jgi:cytochrome c peroxidase
MAARVAFTRTLPRSTQPIKQIIRQRPQARFNSSAPPPPPPPPKSGSWTLPVVGILALGGAGAYYYYYKQSGYADGMAPASAFPIAPGKKGAEEIAKPGDYQAVYNAIAEALEEGADDYDDGSFGPVIVRLAWHASGTYDKETGTGGSNGATMVLSSELRPNVAFRSRV